MLVDGRRGDDLDLYQGVDSLRAFHGVVRHRPGGVDVQPTEGAMDGAGDVTADGADRAVRCLC